MSRKALAPLTDEELITHLKNRKANAFPILTIPSIRSPCNIWLICLSAVIRREQIWAARAIARAAKRGYYRARGKRTNFNPEAERARKQAFYKRYHTEPGYARRAIDEGIEWFKANKAKVYARRAERKPITKQRDQKYNREWHREKRRTDPQYNIGNRLRSRLWHALATSGVKKAHKTTHLVGCSIAELRAHLESLFTTGMTWERFLAGEIHIDHKRPCAAFDLTAEAEQRECFHFSNLQPLWERDNLSKGDRVAA